MRPKVSIIMPVLNGERYIAEAIGSILAQTYKNYELVCVDDGSTDSTPELVKRYRDKLEIRYVRHAKRQGIAASVNDGLRNATGEYVTFLDHDDRWWPRFLETQVNHLETHRDAGMAYSDFETIGPAGDVIERSVTLCRQRTRPSGWIFREIFLDSCIAAISVLIRKECFDRLGGFDESLHWGDYHMWIRIARHYRIDYVPHVLASYRQHPSQSTRDLDTKQPDRDSVAILAIKSILDLYPEAREELGETTVKRRIAALYFDMAYSWLWKEMPGNARACLKKAIPLWPANWRYYVLYALTIVPPSSAKLARRAWRTGRAQFCPTAYRQEQYEART